MKTWKEAVLATAILAVFGALAFAKTVGVTYTDALVIPYNGTQTAGITAAGALTATSLVNTGGVTATSGAFSTTLDVDGNTTLGADGYKSTNTAASGAWAITGSVTSLGALAGTTVNTGQGAYELYKMDQNVDIAAAPAFLGVTVSTSVTSTLACMFAGAVAALPTTGYTECDTVWLVSDHKMYAATETVTGTFSWVADR